MHARVRPRKSSVQKVSASQAPIAMPRTSRLPSVLTPVAIVADGDDASGLAHLQISGVEPQIRPIAFQRPIEEAVDLVVDLAAEAGDLAFADAAHAEGLHKVIDRAGGHALNIGFLDHGGGERSAVRLGSRKAGVARVAQFGHPEFDGAGPRLPASLAKAVALVDAVLAPFAIGCAGEAFGLRVHQALGGKAHHLAQQIGIGALFQLARRAMVGLVIVGVSIGVGWLQLQPYRRSAMTAAVDK